MEVVNQFSSDINDVREAVRGTWGTDITKTIKITYLGSVIIAEGNLEEIKQKCNKQVYDWNKIGDNIYLAWMKN